MIMRRAMLVDSERKKALSSGELSLSNCAKTVTDEWLTKVRVSFPGANARGRD